MIKLYTNRELSENLGINLAKWKRWSREFLPPDPLGGMQSGFARQYYLGNAFQVMLGGHLVSDLNFSVYEARKIIEDLHDWLMENGFYDSKENRENRSSSEVNIDTYKIFIQISGSTKEPMHFGYVIRGLISNKPVEDNGLMIREERYVETVIGPEGVRSGVPEFACEKILNISSLYEIFTGKLG